MISPARDLAFRVLKKVHNGGYASDLLRHESVALSTRDAGLAEAIVMGVLRYQGQLNFLIGHFAGRAQPKLDLEVRIALQMGIYQLRYLDRIPPHAAVMESVELAKNAKPSAAGFANAVLRKVHRNPVKWPDRATELSLPPWMLARWDKQFGAEAAEKIARAALAEPEACINPETGRQQDPGAQTIVPLLEIEPGMTFLDLCAAPGNKTAQAIAAGARVVACDRYLNRLEDVPDAARRVVLDATKPLPFSKKFDRILIDAPCSGTGTLGRNPEIKWRLKPGDANIFAARQREILDQARRLMKPGGRMVYATCSLENEENQNVVQALRLRAETHLRLPGRDPGDGFFAAVITLV
ncbi:MAG: transcription antitermination factor NusB [Bryobacteraceae bacterium]